MVEKGKGEVITVPADRWYKAEAALQAKHEEGAEHFKKGEWGKGAFKFMGAWAPLGMAAVVGGVLYALTDWKTVREIKFFQKHWALRGLAVLLIAIGLFYKTKMKEAAAAFASIAMGILISDYKAYKAAEDEKDKRIKAGIAQAMGGKPEGKPAEATGPGEGDTAGWVDAYGRWHEGRWDVARERATERALLDARRWDEAMATRRLAEEEARRAYVPA
jgi:hypothetical protein